MMCTWRFACYLLVIDLCGPIHIFLALQSKNLNHTKIYCLSTKVMAIGIRHQALIQIFFIACFSIITSYLKILNMHVRKLYKSCYCCATQTLLPFLRGRGSITQLELHPLMESPSNSCPAATHLLRVTRAWSDSKLKLEEGQMPYMTASVLLKRVCDVSFQW